MNNRKNGRAHSIAVIPGDGIGNEVVPAAIKVIDKLAERYGFTLRYKKFPYSCKYYLDNGYWFPRAGIEELQLFDALFVGAVGSPQVPDHESLWGLLIPLRRQMQQYINLRPVKLLPGVSSPLAGRGPDDFNMMIVRENNEGEYSEAGGRLFQGTSDEIVTQESIFTRKGVDRVLRYAFDLAMTRPAKRLTSATKSNGIRHTMVFWDERLEEIRKEYPEVEVDQYHIDILTAHFVKNPDRFDVVVASNLFGDILSDLGPALVGSVGIAPSANLNPEKSYPSMFEPVHGSAPDLAGKGVANPIGAMWSAEMMLKFLGEVDAATTMMRAVKMVTSDGKTTPDLGGSETTDSFTECVLDALDLIY